MSKKIISLILLSLSVAPAAYAYVASSTNYRIELDSVNFSGGLGTSTNYKMESTLGESGTGIINSTNYRLSAGYQQMSGAGATTLTISAPSDITLSPAIPQGTNASADGSASWTVTTNNASGYSLTIAAATSPALAATGDSFADYTPATSNPDFTFNVGANQSVFAFTPEGSDVASRFLDNGSTCATGSSNTSSACWDGLSTSAKTIATSASASLSGTITTVRFRAAVGSNKTQGSGTYSAAVTLTATTL